MFNPGELFHSQVIHKTKGCKTCFRSKVTIKEVTSSANYPACLACFLTQVDVRGAHARVKLAGV